MIHVQAHFWPQPILLMLAAHHQNFTQNRTSERAHRFIDSSCILHYLGAHHNIVF